MPLNVVETLSQLIAIPSVNTMGRSVSGPEYLETSLTAHLEKVFDSLGLANKRQQVEPGRDNIIARLDGETPPEHGGPIILIDAHQDTVPVDGMTIAPWTPLIRDERVYGRGACDTKGGMAASLVAISRLASERPPGMPTVVMCCTVDEENGFTGVKKLEKLWDRPGDSLIPRRPDAAISLEPTALEVVVAHKGTVRWRCHTQGVSAHSARPNWGDNAVYMMARVITALERYHDEVLCNMASHQMCGLPTLSVCTVHGGEGANTIPDRCTIEIDRRLIPGEDEHKAIQHVTEFLEKAPNIDFPVRHSPPFTYGPPLANDANGTVANRLLIAAQQVLSQSDSTKTSKHYSTDAAFLAAAGVPSVVFGPGFFEQAHTADEWVPIPHLESAAEILYQFILSYTQDVRS